MRDSERQVLDLSVQVMERMGGLDINANLQIKELRQLEARWGDAVRRMMADRSDSDA